MNVYEIKDSFTFDETRDWIESAARIDRVMASAKIAGYRGFWPDIPKDPNEAYGYNEEEPRPEPATNREATIWYIVSQWGVALDNDYEREIVWSRAKPRPVPYKVLGRKHNCSRDTIYRDWKNCINTICVLLNMHADFEKIGRDKMQRVLQKNAT